MTTPLADEHSLLVMARQGDHQAFTALTEPYRRELLVYGYRLLGSFQDSEDLIQETLLRAWTKLASFAGRSTFRAWLYKIATNTGLNMLARSSRQSLPTETMPPATQAMQQMSASADSRWLEPILDSALSDPSTAPDAVYSLRESVSLAFMVALFSLPPPQRAILILRDVLDWHADEVAALLEKSVPAVNSGLQRARATLAKQYHPIGLDAIEAPTLTAELQALFDRYIQAWESNDIEALTALLKEDATFSMPPQPLWFSGPLAIGQFFREAVFTTSGPGEWRLVPTRANAQPACVLYRRDPSTDSLLYFGLVVLTLDANGGNGGSGSVAIAAFTAFLDTALCERYHLPRTLP